MVGGATQTGASAGMNCLVCVRMWAANGGGSRHKGCSPCARAPARAILSLVGAAPLGACWDSTPREKRQAPLAHLVCCCSRLRPLHRPLHLPLQAACWPLVLLPCQWWYMSCTVPFGGGERMI